MKAREVARKLFNREMAARSSREWLLRTTIRQYEEFQREMKRSKDPQIALVEMVLELARQDLERALEEKEKIQQMSAEFYAEARIGGYSETEIPDAETYDSQGSRRNLPQPPAEPEPPAVNRIPRGPLPTDFWAEQGGVEESGQCPESSPGGIHQSESRGDEGNG